MEHLDKGAAVTSVAALTGVVVSAVYFRNRITALEAQIGKMEESMKQMNDMKQHMNILYNKIAEIESNKKKPDEVNVEAVQKVKKTDPYRRVVISDEPPKRKYFSDPPVYEPHTSNSFIPQDPKHSILKEEEKIVEVKETAEKADVISYDEDEDEEDAIALMSAN